MPISKVKDRRIRSFIEMKSLRVSLFWIFRTGKNTTAARQPCNRYTSVLDNNPVIAQIPSSGPKAMLASAQFQP